MRATPLHPTLLILATALAACSGAQGQEPMAAAPEPRTRAVLAGPLCQADECRCKRSDGDAGEPAAGSKRFEIRLGPSKDPLWATVDGMVLFKHRERIDACYYVDLTPGPHEVSLRGQGQGGLSVAMAIAEQGGGEGDAWWYSTFDFTCGAPGVCALEDIREWKERVAPLAGKHDPCGSTKVKSIEWETGRMPDRSHPDDLLLKLRLDVHKFVPKHPPGSGACDGGGETDEGTGPDPEPDPAFDSL
jgi:hypothetical protein